MRYDRLVERIVSSPDLEEVERGGHHRVLCERMAAGHFDPRVGDRVCKRAKPWERGRVNTVGHGVVEVHFDEGPVEVLSFSDIKGTER